MGSARTYFLFFFFNDTATTEIYTLPLHAALPIYYLRRAGIRTGCLDPLTNPEPAARPAGPARPRLDRKSTRLNSSHPISSYAVLSLTKKQTYLTVPGRAAPRSAPLTPHQCLPRYR